MGQTRTDTAHDSPYLTADAAAAYLHYPTTAAFLKAVKRLGIPVIKRGRHVLATRELLDSFMATRITRPGRSTRVKGGR